MLNQRLIARVREHYESRSFSPRLVESLCLEIERRTHPDGLEIARGWHVPLEALCEVFAPVEQARRPAILHPAPAAILAFSFGCRLDSPFARLPDERRPGPNNEALAGMTRACHAIFPEAWIAALQHEIGLALAAEDTARITPELVTPPRDWNTQQVVDHFVAHLPRYAFVGQSLRDRREPSASLWPHRAAARAPRARSVPRAQGGRGLRGLRPR